MTAEPLPRIVRLLPGRFSRDPKAPGTKENTAAALLLACTVAAILWANSPWAETYWAFLDTHVGFTFGDNTFELTVRHLINDGLMTFFFFIVGLEVTSEFTIGGLTDRARASVPVVAAIAGLTVPAVIFLLFNASGENAQAWGVVISTDTAFLIGALAIIKPKYPARLRIFLLTLAVVDDIGALCVIALFYSDRIQVVPLVVAVALIIAIASGPVPTRGRGPAYAALGFALWIALSIGGVHPTLAGVALALLIPVFTPDRQQVEQTVDVIRAFRQSPNSQYARAATRGLRESISINERLQAEIGPYVAFVVLPLFALANAGVRLGTDSVMAALQSKLTWGIVVGLVVGKFIGITGATWFMQRTRLGQLAPGLTLRRVAGGAALSGIGFTIALFIVDIAITQPTRQDQARIGVLARVCGGVPRGMGDLPDHRLGQPTRTGGAQADPPVDPDRDHIRGNPHAPLTLVEYGDYECPFCSRATGGIDEVRAHFGDELRYVWRHLPLERVHPRAFDAATGGRGCRAAGKVLRDGEDAVRAPGRSGVVGHLSLRQRDRA